MLRRNKRSGWLDRRSRSRLTAPARLIERAERAGDSYFEKCENVAFTRGDHGVLVLRFHSGGGPVVFTGQTPQTSRRAEPRRDFPARCVGEDSGRGRQGAAAPAGPPDAWLLWTGEQNERWIASRSERPRRQARPLSVAAKVDAQSEAASPDHSGRSVGWRSKV